ncbi:xylose isomerase [Brucella endophytica]|uniref:Xylose isomerase n=1 Tax=Brucella endophytica TaxID=1963359 RepID=A0A916WH43_9HYPH|nr:TIM barrel protein [Brucella endophytica]GGA99107.1 xylose isomerase [Brucella endophytica]
MRHFEPGLCSVTFRGMTPDAIIELAASSGLKAIEWGADIHVPPGDLHNARAIGVRTIAAGLTVSSYGSYIFAPDATMPEVTAALDTAEALGTSHIRVWAGSRKRPSAEYLPAERMDATNALASIASRAAEREMTIGLEYHPNSLTDSLQSSLQLARDLPFPNLFFYWQPAPGLPLDEALAEIAALGDRIGNLHVFAWKADFSRLPLRDRVDYWRACIKALPTGERGGKNYALLEFVRNDSPEQFRADAAALRTMLNTE